MKLEATTRLQLDAASAITYEDYAQVVASLAPGYVVAFTFPSVLRGLKDDLQHVADMLRETANVGLDAVLKAFKEKSVFTLLKGVGFSLIKLLKAVKLASSVFSNALYHALEDLREMVGNSAAFKSLRIPERLEVLDRLLKKYPVIAKLSGIVVAGLLMWMWLHASFLGHDQRDLDLVDSVIACVRGNFDLKELFTSPAGVHGLACLAFGLATGGAGITAYGFDKVSTALTWVSGDVYNLLLALFYAAAKHIHMSVGALPSQLRAYRHQDWYHRLPDKDKARYRKKFPGTRFHNKDRLIAP